ncbi:hypothetical protein A9Q91_02840 [Candidatus Gracilibacteria bacterium 28_42_T64]|nr:hypothetical protein A9Q91_02840 [Candidatus Gracilibacteria bacterium 28_42_T64]
MKTIIKSYTTPEVNYNILQSILQRKNSKKKIFSVISYIAYSAIFLLFTYNLMGLNIEYSSAVLSLSNLALLFQIFINIIVGIIHFVTTHLYMILGLYIIAFMSNIYSIS